MLKRLPEWIREIKRVLKGEEGRRLGRSESIGMETETRLEIVKVVWPEEKWQPLIRGARRGGGSGRTGGEAGEA